MQPTPEVITALEEIYAQLPDIECQGHCWNSCGPIDMSHAERERIRVTTGVQIQEFTAERSYRWSVLDEPLHCNALDKFHRCTVYEVRPFICRAWGVGRGQLACPHGCEMTGKRLRHREILRLQMQTYRVGGGDIEGFDAELMVELLGDDHIAELMARFTNGERWLLEELQDAVFEFRRQRGD